MPGPLFAWGTPEDLAGAQWTRTNVTATGGQADPFGGTAAFTLQDTSAGAVGNAFRVVAVPSNGAHTVAVFARGNGAPSFDVQLFDATATATRYQARILVDGAGLMTVGATIAGSGAAALVRLSMGAAPWYLVVLRADGLIAANTNQLALLPHADPVSGTLATFFYLRPTFTHGYDLDGAVAGPMARAGSAAMRAQSGVEDAWDAGTDEELRGSVRYIPPSMIADPPCSGYDGDGSGLVGVGFRALLRAGRRRDVIRYCRDRANTAEFVDGYLVEPYDSLSGSVETDGTVSVPIALRSDTPYRAYL